MATFSGIENFDGYSVGGLDTLNGASGWSGAWTHDVGSSAAQVETAQFVSSPNGAGLTGVSNSNDNIYRAATTTASGDSTIIHASCYATSLIADNNTYMAFGFMTAGGNNYLLVTLSSNGTCIALSAGGGNVTIATGLSAGTWYHVYGDFDFTNKKVRGYVSTTIPNSPQSFSTYTSAAASADATRFYLLPQSNNLIDSANLYIDDIRDGAADFTSSSIPLRALRGVGK